MECTWPRCVCKATGVYCEHRKPTGPVARKAIRKVSEKGKIKKLEKAALFPNDAAFYFEIWSERAHVDFETGEPIYGQALSLYFHHVLEKKNYPQYRYCKWNIILLNWQSHGNADNFKSAVPKVKAYTEKLLKLHESGRLDLIDPNIHKL